MGIAGLLGFWEYGSYEFYDRASSLARLKHGQLGIYVFILDSLSLSLFYLFYYFFFFFPAEDELLQSAIMLQNGTGGGAPLAAMLTDLPPQRGFCTSTTMRQFNDVHYAAANAAVAAAGSTATLGRNKNRWV